MAEKMAERIAEILKEPNFQTAEKALTNFCGPMDGEFRNLLVDIIVERWIDTPKDVPFSYARSIWNRKDINREGYQALLEEIRSYPIAPINKAKISDFLWVVENDFSNAKIAETAYYEHLKKKCITRLTAQTMHFMLHNTDWVYSSISTDDCRGFWNSCGSCLSLKKSEARKSMKRCERIC